MADIAMIGEYDSVLLAKAAGIDAYGTDDKQQAARIITRLAREGTKVIFITEEMYAQCADVINKYKTAPFPAILPIPGSHGTNGMAMAEIKANVEKAIGVDILFQDNKEDNR